MNVLKLLGEWGDIGCCDIDYDNDVGITDLLALIAAWGEDCAGEGSLPTSVGECLQRYNDPDEQAACICMVEPCTDGCPPCE